MLKKLEIFKPIKLAVEALCRRDINLLTADAILHTLCQKISKIQSRLAQKMTEALVSRIKERRNVVLCTLLKYLQNSEFFASADENMFSRCTKTSALQFADNQFNRLFHNYFQTDENSDADCDFDCSSSNISFEKELNNAIDNASINVRAKTSNRSKNILKSEFKLFEATGKRGSNLEHLYNAVLTIKPTSVESERSFSVAGNFATKIRNKLSNETLNALCVLKSFYNELETNK